MGKSATVLVALGACALVLVTLVPNSAEAGWRRWAWRTAPVTVYTDPGYVYAPGYVYDAPGYYGPAYPPYPYATAYAYGYPYYGPYWRARCRRGWC